MYKKLICMTCYKGSSSGICCAGYNDPDICHSYQKQYICPRGLVFDEPYNCYECAKTCTGCMEMRVKFGIVSHDEVAHLLKG